MARIWNAHHLGQAGKSFVNCREHVCGIIVDTFFRRFRTLSILCYGTYLVFLCLFLSAVNAFVGRSRVVSSFISLSEFLRIALVVHVSYKYLVMGHRISIFNGKLALSCDYLAKWSFTVNNDFNYTTKPYD